MRCGSGGGGPKSRPTLTTLTIIFKGCAGHRAPVTVHDSVLRLHRVQSRETPNWIIKAQGVLRSPSRSIVCLSSSGQLSRS